MTTPVLGVSYSSKGLARAVFAFCGRVALQTYVVTSFVYSVFEGSPPTKFFAAMLVTFPVLSWELKSFYKDHVTNSTRLYIKGEMIVALRGSSVEKYLVSSLAKAVRKKIGFTEYSHLVFPDGRFYSINSKMENYREFVRHLHQKRPDL